MKSFSDILAGMISDHHSNMTKQERAKALLISASKDARRIAKLESITNQQFANMTAEEKQTWANALVKTRQYLDDKLAQLALVNEEMLNVHFNRQGAAREKKNTSGKAKEVLAVGPNSAIPVKLKPHIDKIVTRDHALNAARTIELNEKGQFHIVQKGKVIAGPFKNEALANDWLHAHDARNLRKEHKRDFTKINHRIEEKLRDKK